MKLKLHDLVEVRGKTLRELASGAGLRNWREFSDSSLTMRLMEMFTQTREPVIWTHDSLVAKRRASEEDDELVSVVGTPVPWVELGIDPPSGAPPEAQLRLFRSFGLDTAILSYAYSGGSDAANVAG